MVQVNSGNYFGRVNRNICWTIYFYVSEKLSCRSDAQKIKVVLPTKKICGLVETVIKFIFSKGPYEMTLLL